MCSVPITNDITEFVGDHDMYIEIESDGEVIGKSNLVRLKVHPFSGLGEEIIRREVYIAEIERLNDIKSGYESDLESVKNALIYKGVTVGDDTPTSSYGTLVRNIPGVPENVFRGVIDNSISGHLDILYGTTNIPMYKFQNCDNLISVTLPSTIERLEDYAFANCVSLKTINIPHGVTRLGSYTFGYCYQLESVTIPNTLTSVNSTTFAACPSLRNVTIEHGFNANYLSLDNSTQYTAETIVGWLNALADRTGLSAYTFYIGPANLNKLTTQQIAVAINKNWNLA